MATGWSCEILYQSAKTRCKILSSARGCSLLAVCVNLSCPFKNKLGLIFFCGLGFFLPILKLHFCGNPTLPTVLLTPSASKAADMAHLCVPQNQALGVCRGFAPDIQICGTHGRKNLVNATIISNAEEEEEAEIRETAGKMGALEMDAFTTKPMRWPWRRSCSCQVWQCCKHKLILQLGTGWWT